MESEMHAVDQRLETLTETVSLIASDAADTKQATNILMDLTEDTMPSEVSSPLRWGNGHTSQEVKCDA